MFRKCQHFSPKEVFILPRSMWILLSGMMINMIGSSFLWPLNTIYLHDYLGKSLSLAGFVLMLNSLASVIGNFLGGYLFDKIGGYKSVLIGAIISLGSLIGLTLFHGWPHYAVFLIIVGFGSAIVNPAMYALAGATWKEGGRSTFNAMYVSANVGVAIGTAACGYIASLSIVYIFPANMLLYVVFFFIVIFGFKRLAGDADVTARPARKMAGKGIERLSKSIIALTIVSIGYVIAHIAYSQWQTTIATYTQEINISLEQYSLLWTTNGALIVFGQPFIAFINRTVTKKLKSQIMVGYIIFMAAFFIASKSISFTGFLTAMIILTVGEMFVWPAIPAIANDLAEPGRSGFYQGFVNGAATIGRMIGPVLGGVVVDYFDMSALFTLLLALFIIAIVSTLIYDRGLFYKEKRSKTTELL